MCQTKQNNIQGHRSYWIIIFATMYMMLLCDTSLLVYIRRYLKFTQTSSMITIRNNHLCKQHTPAFTTKGSWPATI